MKYLKTAALVTLAIAMLAAVVLAQAAPETSAPETRGVSIRAKGPMMTFHLETDMDAAPVKGAPFCANVTTEHNQPFADGNRIHSSDSSTLCRDSEGRTRREAGLNLMGAGPEGATRLVTISDPVAGVRYTLDADNKVAFKSSISSTSAAPVGPPAGGLADKQKRIVIKSVDGPQVMTSDMFYRADGHAHDETAGSTEELGTQSFNGIRATGTRMTTTIPAGPMGNEKPMTISSERWYSSELKATVMTTGPGVICPRATAFRKRVWLIQW